MHAQQSESRTRAQAPVGSTGLTRSESSLSGAAVPDWWSELYADADAASVFLSPAWMQTWLEVYGGGFKGSWLRWQSEDRTVGGCLLLKHQAWRRCWPLLTVSINTAEDTGARSPCAEFNGVLHLGGYEQPIARDLASALRATGWTRLQLPAYEDSPLTHTLLADLPLSGLQCEQAPSPYVDFAALGAQEYEATLSAKTRSQIRRCRRIYTETHGPVLVEPAAGSEEAIAFLDRLAVLHNATWRSRGISGAFSSEAFLHFHRKLIRRLWPARGADVLRIRAGDKVIGYLYSLLLRGKVYCYQSGLSQEHDNNLKPGMLSHACAIEHYRERGYREYDFLAGDMRYKRSLAKSQRTLLWSTGYRRSLYGRAALLAKGLTRTIAARRLSRSPDAPSAVGGARGAIG